MAGGGETDPKRSASLYHERHLVSVKKSARMSNVSQARCHWSGNISTPMPFPTFHLALTYSYSSSPSPRDRLFLGLSTKSGDLGEELALFNALNWVSHYSYKLER